MASTAIASHVAQNPQASYEQTMFAANVAQEVHTEQERGLMDKQYLKGVPGLMKALEVVFSLVAFLCVTIGAVVCVPWVATTGFFNFIAMAALLTTLVLYALLLFKVQDRIFRCDCCQWPLMELGYYGVVVVLYFFGVLFLSLHGCVGAHKAGAAFGWFAVFAYSADGAMSLRRFLAWRKERNRPPATIEGGMNVGGPMGGIATTDLKY